MNIEQFLSAAMDQDEDDGPFSKYAANTPERVEFLKEKYALLMEKHTFKPGDLVRWKEGLRNKTGDYESAYIVVESLDEPILDTNRDASSSYFREPLDVCIMTLDNDGDGAFMWLDSRRIEPWQEQACTG